MTHFMRLLRVVVVVAMLLSTTGIDAQRHWTAADGLPTGEVRQIVELPNGQMLVNCEGIFCISNGQSFDEISLDQNCAYQLPQYADMYGQWWQGDSLLWLHDFYRIYLFDARRCTFVTDIDTHFNDRTLKKILDNSTYTPPPTAEQFHIIDSIHVRDVTLATTDRQGGLWIGLRTGGIVYQPPRRALPKLHTGDDPVIGWARGASMRSGQTTFIVPLPDGRLLRCDSLCHLSYSQPDNRQVQPLNRRLPALRAYRYMVGACPIDDQWTVVYTQNGIFMLDTQADTLAPFPYAKEIERYSSKYNCMLKDDKGRLWIGTQNGLFSMADDEVVRVSGLTNNCIRSLVLDAQGEVWAGTSYGISRITPSVVNLSSDDGIPATAMMDRAALLLADGRLAFAAGASLGVSFRPDELIGNEKPLPVVITRITVNGEHVQSIPQNLPHTQNYISFQFSTLNYATPSHDRYRYRLQRLEHEWNICNNGCGLCMTDYKALPPGNYTFEAQAATASGEWGPVTQQTFVIRPPWWLTWWMKLFYGVVILVILVILVNHIIKRKRARLEAENEERVNRLFEMREEARHRFAESANIAPDKIAVNAEEEKLVAEMLKAIEANMDNEQYNAALLARDVAMSRASLYSKLSVILGITPTDFIRNVRLKRAAQMLTETTWPINEIADRVGFVTPRNFSTQFKNMFGVLPSDYRGGKKCIDKTVYEG